MSSVVISGDTSGSITLQAPAVAGSNTFTLPAATGTVMVSGNMPAFSAYLSSSQTISGSTQSKITFQTKEFDTANAYDNTTNYRFTPQVAGYYQVNSGVAYPGSAVELVVSIYKNGSQYKYGQDVQGTNTWSTTVSAIVYLNGSTDYIEIYAYQSGSSRSPSTGVTATYIQSAMIRSA